MTFRMCVWCDSRTDRTYCARCQDMWDKSAAIIREWMKKQ